MRGTGGRGGVAMIVKVCGVRTAEVAEAAVTAGADWIGLVFEPRSPRNATDAEARSVVDAVGRHADLIGVFVEPDAATCHDAAARYGLAAVQVHGEVQRDFVTECDVPVIRGLNVATRAEAMTAEAVPAPGRFGAYGGAYVPETLVPALDELEAAMADAFADAAFTDSLDTWLHDYAGRPTPLTRCRRLVDGGASIWLKREDL